MSGLQPKPETTDYNVANPLTLTNPNVPTDTIPGGGPENGDTGFRSGLGLLDVNYNLADDLTKTKPETIDYGVAHPLTLTNPNVPTDTIPGGGPENGDTGFRSGLGLLDVNYNLADDFTKTKPETTDYDMSAPLQI